MPSKPLLRLTHELLAAADRQLWRFRRVLAELPLVLADPELERFGIDRHYARTEKYASAEGQRAGLFPFEERSLKRYFPAPPAALLVPGCGGGREVLALKARGYRVHGFDPVPSMVAAANRLIDGTDAHVERSSLQEWAAEPTGSFDGILTGWGMWTHLVHQSDRLSALRAFRAVSPAGPVLLSFWRLERTFDHEELPDEPLPLHPNPEDRFEHFTRVILRRKLLRLPPVERGTIWQRGMFVHLTSEAELAEEAGMAGYELICYERDASRYPHAVLRPRGQP